MEKALKEILEMFDKALETPEPSPLIAYSAKYLMGVYPRDILPDWMEALANANLNIWEKAVDEVRRLKEAEEKEKKENG